MGITGSNLTAVKPMAAYSAARLAPRSASPNTSAISIGSPDSVLAKSSGDG